MGALIVSQHTGQFSGDCPACLSSPFAPPFAHLMISFNQQTRSFGILPRGNSRREREIRQQEWERRQVGGKEIERQMGGKEI